MALTDRDACGGGRPSGAGYRNNSRGGGWGRGRGAGGGGGRKHDQQSHTDVKASPNQAVWVAKASLVDETQQQLEQPQVRGQEEASTSGQTGSATSSRNMGRGRGKAYTKPAHQSASSKGQARDAAKACCSSNYALTQAELAQNLQDQADEVLALKSIFGDDAFREVAAYSDGHVHYFQLFVNVDPLASIELRPYQSARQEDEFPTQAAPAGSQQHAVKSQFSVDYLPPLRLTCILPKHYPSAGPPHFKLTSSWLSTAVLSKLCQGLDKQWQEQKGSVVVYTWAEWLRTSVVDDYLSCGYLSLAGNYNQGMDATHLSDNRALSEIDDVDSTLFSLLRYNQDCKLLDFRSSIHDCPVCLMEYAGTQFHRLNECGHYCCLTCMVSLVSIHVKDGTVHLLVCPQDKCKTPLPPSLLKEVLPPVGFARWEELMLQRTLDSMADLVYCPRCEVAVLEDADNHAQCASCFYSFCSLCRQPWHAGAECLTPEARLEILRQRQSNCQDMNADKKKQEEALVNEVMAFAFVKQAARQCPSCRMAIQKTEGCNKMICSNCGGFFCYRCGKSIEGYEHYRDGTCTLFEEETLREWNARMGIVNLNEAQVRMQARLQIHPDQAVNLKACPNCGQHNLKEGRNNHIACWSCTTHFCAVCRSLVKGTKHFSKGGCKQHSDD